MLMGDYIKEVKRQMRDKHGFKPIASSTDEEPIFCDIPDGEYPVTIRGKLDHVRIKDGMIDCCNFDE